MRRIINTLSIIVMLCVGVPTLAVASQCGRVVEPMTPEAILNRIKPVGTVDVAGGGPQVAAVEVELGPDAGQERYNSTCKVCHESGMAGAPKFRNEADWKKYTDTGIDEMLKVAIQGKGAMPPKGNCPQCSEKELKMTIEYMIPQKK